MKQISKTVYVADDGTEFVSMQDCAEHDRKLRRDASLMLTDIPHTFSDCDSLFMVGDFTYGIGLFRIENKEHAKRFSQWAGANDVPVDADEILGSICAVLFYHEGDGASIDTIYNVLEIINIQDLIISFAQSVYRLVGEIKWQS